MYKDKTTPRTDFPNYFNCSLIVGEFRYCEFHSDLPFSRFWVVYIVRLPPTSGGDFIINGTFLRVSGGPNTLDFFTRDDHLKLVVKGNFSDPSFNCNSITVTFRPDGGLILLVFGELGGGEYRISYAPRMISSIVHNPSKQIITINGDNFFNDDRKVGVFFEKIYQPNINVTINHTQIQVNNFNRVDLGPISIAVVVKDLYIEKNYIHCFPAILTSITSVSNVLGGIVTIKGSKLSSTSNSSLIPSITIGNKQCKYIKSTTTELECKLDPNESGGKKLSVDVNFNGCNSTSSGSSAVIFTYNIPTLSSGSYSNGIVTLIGKNLGNYQESFIQLYANGIITKIDKFNTSSDEKILTIKLSLLRCNSVNINFNMDGISSNNLSISVSLLTNIINKPSVSNVTFYIELYYIDCPISSSTPTITFSNSLTNQCSIPSLQSSTSDFYQTTFSIPYGTGINKQYTFKYIK